MIVKEQMLSKIQKNILENRDNKHDDTEKLIMNLYDKDEYVCAGTTLKLYLQQGLKIKNIKRVIQFKQDYIMKDYIIQNTIKRNKCKKEGDEFGKQFYKLMNNIIYGKTIENVRKRINFKLTSSTKLCIVMTHH
jgi:hypothetical protein